MTPDETIALRGAARYVQALRRTAEKRLAESGDAMPDLAAALVASHHAMVSIADTLTTVVELAMRHEAKKDDSDDLQR